jgi:hypothetical protein
VGFLDWTMHQKAHDNNAALRVLGDLQLRRITGRQHLWEWKHANSLLRDRYTREVAAGSTDQAAMRVHYLEVAEPRPQLEDFAPSTLPRWEQCAAVLADMSYRLQQSLADYPHREQLRAQELAYAHRVYEHAEAAARARLLQYQLSLWPKGVELDQHIAEIEGVEGQVDAQNDEIERRVRHLGDLLVRALHDLPEMQSESPNAGGDDIDPAAIATDIECGLTLINLPHEFPEPSIRAAFTPESRQAVVEYELPDVSIVPAAKAFRYIKSRKQITMTERPVAQIKALYAGAIQQLTLLGLAATFSSNPRIDVVVFNGVVDTLDPRSGQPIRPCLITVRVTREVFAGINLAHVDPQACLKHLSAGVSKSPTELSPVRPVVEFSMVDPRFIAETDVISGMDQRPNLLELTPTEFESLISNLFTRMGLETRQTQASRDGGVDCVAWDTRPIFGGKVVIQAKRYKNTVGVSAVRDLYGTLQNEGASKGILVTTSGYGAASFDFAQNKPIELIEGTGLLYLLEEHAGVTAKIEAPDDWCDPVPDAFHGETDQDTPPSEPTQR